MKRTLVIVFLGIWSSFSYAQRNYAQELVDFLQQGRCFEAKELYMNHADKLPQNDTALHLLYKSHIALFFNKPDSAEIYLEELLGNTNYQMTLGPITDLYYMKLLTLYVVNQQFDLAMKLCDKMLDYCKINPFNYVNDSIQSIMNSLKNAKTTLKEREIYEPRIKIYRNSERMNESIQLYEDNRIRFDAYYNGIPIETLFDTGLDFHLAIVKSLADEIGVKVSRENQNTQRVINGIPTKAYQGIIDSIELGNIKLYNIPVLVFKETITPPLPDTLNDIMRKEIERVFKDRQIAIGVPTMRLIGKFEFDWNKNTLSFPEDGISKIGNTTSNICFIDNELYMRLKFNGLNYSGRLDTGSDNFLTITPSYYEMNKSSIEIYAEISQPYDLYTVLSTSLNIPYKLVKRSGVFFRGREIKHEREPVLVIEKPAISNKLDGFIGVLLFKSILPKVLLDFENMEIELKD